MEEYKDWASRKDWGWVGVKWDGEGLGRFGDGTD